MIRVDLIDLLLLGHECQKNGPGLVAIFLFICSTSLAKIQGVML